MKTFLKKIAFYLSIFLTVSISLYLTSKHNLIFDTPAKKFVTEFTSADVIVNREIAEDRRTSYQLAQLRSNQHFRYLILGSSRIMQLGKNTNFPSALNLGVSAATLRDLTELQKIIKDFRITCDTFILDLNPWTVAQYQEQSPNQFNTFDNLKTGLSDIFKFNFKPQNFWELFANQPTLKKANVRDIQNPNYFIRFTDGSIKQKKLGPNMKSGRVDFFCNDLYLLKHCDKIDSNRFFSFLNLIHKESKKHHVIVFLSPFHPALFVRRKDDIRVRNLQKLEQLFIAKKPKNVSFVGSFNPDNLKFTDDNFIDGFHINEPSIKHLFQNNRK